MVDRVCEHCGAGFRTYPSRVKRGSGRFCSRSCGAKAREPYERTEAHKAQMSATLAGRPGVPHAIEAAAAARRGRPPSKRNRETTSAMWTGEGNPQWKDGRSYERYGPGYWGRKVRAAVIARDKVCRDCGQWDDRPRAMHVHHLDGDRKNHDLGNLLLLCLACHKARHRQ